MPTAKVNGLEMHYEIQGEGTPLVLNHGFQNSIFAWKPVVEALAERFRVIRWDMRGHGDSEKPEGPYRIADFSNDLLGLLDALGLEKVDLMGHSMGGRTALMFAIDHGERLKRLMLVSASAGPPSGDYRAHFERIRRIAVHEGIGAVFESKQLRALLPPALLEGPDAEEYRTRYMKNTVETYSWTAEALFGMSDLTDRLHKIAVPTWVCFGENDAGPLAFSDLFASRIPRCTRSILPGSGHFPMWDCPEGFLAAFFEFVEKNPVP